MKGTNYTVDEPTVAANYDVARIRTQKMLNTTPSKGDNWLKAKLDEQAKKRGGVMGSDGYFQLGTEKGPRRR